jgi:hypothetical protein
MSERGAKARDAGGRMAVPGTLRLARLGTRGLAGWGAGRSARQVGGPDGAGPQLTARGAQSREQPWREHQRIIGPCLNNCMHSVERHSTTPMLLFSRMTRWVRFPRAGIHIPQMY